MPTNLHALIRYRTIDSCLRDTSRAWGWQDLGDACESALDKEMGVDRKLSRRTVMYDLKHMKSGVLGYHAPIVFDREEKSYRYSDSSFSINSAPVGPGTLKELDQALLILRQFSGQEKIEGIGNVIATLEHTLNIQRSDEAQPVIQFEQGLNEPGQKWVNTIYEHIKNEACLTISYIPFGKEIQHYTVSPYLLKEYNNRWFLFAYNHKSGSIQNIALDRIDSIKISLKSFKRVKDFDPKVYFEDIIGVSITPDEPVAKVVIEVFGKQANYVKTKPLHRSQKLVKDKKRSAVFSYRVIPNFELETKLLSLGDHVKVLKPAALGEKVATRLASASKLYATPKAKPTTKRKKGKKKKKCS